VPGSTPDGNSDVHSSRSETMGGTTPRPRSSAAVGRLHSSRIELTNLSSLEWGDLGGVGPARRTATFSKVRAESIHARFVVLVCFFGDDVDLSRSCVDAEDRGRE
jgi:hypothetical protein